MSTHLRSPFAGNLFAIVITSMVGCGGQPQITKYETPKEATAPSQGAAAPISDSGSGASADTKGRMLAAIVPQDDRDWFFKLVGPDEGVAKQTESFDVFVHSIEFAGGQPKWKLPEGWNEKPGSGIRFATINVGQPGLDVSVISLPKPQDVLDNVNRWRGQLQTASLTKEQLAEEAQEIEIGGQTATLVNLAGNMKSGGGPPFMRGGGPFSGGAGPMATGTLPPDHPPISGGPPPTTLAASADSRAPNPGFRFATPEGWEPGRAGGMRKLAFNTKSDDGSTEFTVITLPKAGAAILPNVNRWRGQVGLDPVDEDGLADVTSEIQVSGSPGTLIEMIGPDGPNGDTTPKAMSVVMAERDGVVWFYKMMGEAPAVTKEQEHFNAFIQSIEFPSK